MRNHMNSIAEVISGGQCLECCSRSGTRAMVGTKGTAAIIMALEHLVRVWQILLKGMDSIFDS